MQASRSLWVAIAAAALLVLVVAVDASVNRTVRLEVETEQGWQTITSSSEEPYRRFGGEVTIEANRSDEVRFRLVVDNEPPWGYEEAYRVRSDAGTVATGTLTAEPGAQGTATFTATVDELTGGPRAPLSQESPHRMFANVHVELGGTFLYGSFQVEEVSG